MEGIIWELLSACLNDCGVRSSVSGLISVWPGDHRTGSQIGDATEAKAIIIIIFSFSLFPCKRIATEFAKVGYCIEGIRDGKLSKRNKRIVQNITLTFYRRPSNLKKIFVGWTLHHWIYAKWKIFLYWTHSIVSIPSALRFFSSRIYRPLSVSFFFYLLHTGQIYKNGGPFRVFFCCWIKHYFESWTSFSWMFFEWTNFSSVFLL